MPTVVGVQFRPTTKIYYFDPGNFQLQEDDRVIVETSRGTEIGKVVLPNQPVPQDEIKGKLKRIVRQATPLDLLEAEKYRTQEPEALETCRKLAAKHKLDLKIISAEYSFDGSRLLFTFVAEQRIDFRNLVRELTRALQTRIEMRQIGARDETKLMDGYGRCGYRFCCASWLTEFHPVSIRMAKKQDLPLAPSEISGTCGRLLCCLAYENDFYIEAKKRMPKPGSQVQTEQGIPATVKNINVIKETVLLEIEGSDSYLEVEADSITIIEDSQESRKSSKRRRRRGRKKRRGK